MAMAGCGDAAFTPKERDAVRSACVARYGQSAGDVRQFCECSVAALGGANAAELRENRSAFLDEHLGKTTIVRCA